MSVNLTLVIAAAALVACGVYLLLERSLTRVLVGLVILGNGVNLTFLVASGDAGAAPFYGAADPTDMSDPLPQALVLTAIVITLGTVAFVLALGYRSWQLFGNDDVQDDVEDAEIRRRAEADETSQSYALDRDDLDDEEPAEDDGRGVAR